MFLFWVLLIIGLVWLFRERLISGEAEKEIPKETPLEILQRRYASGEISTEKYLEIKEELMGD